MAKDVFRKALFPDDFSQKNEFPDACKSFGADGYTAESIEDLTAIMKNNLRDDRPCVIDCKIDMDENVLPMIPPGGSINNVVLE